MSTTPNVEIHANDSVEFVFVLLDHEGRPSDLTGWTVAATVERTEASFLWNGTGEVQLDPHSALVEVPANTLGVVGDYTVTIKATKGTKKHSAVGTVRVN